MAIPEIMLSTIKALNAIAEPHFTNGGHFMGTGDESQDCMILAANYARWAMEPSRKLASCICDLRRASEEITRACAFGGVDMIGDPTRETVLNAVALATGYVCERAEALESKRRKRSE